MFRARSLTIPHADFCTLSIKLGRHLQYLLPLTLLRKHFSLAFLLYGTTCSLLSNLFGAGSIYHKELTAFLVANDGVVIWVYHFFSCIFLVWKLNHTHTSNLDKPVPVTQNLNKCKCLHCQVHSFIIFGQ